LEATALADLSTTETEGF